MNRVLWLSGPSGAGKTALAKRLQKERPCVILDGDEMRDSISLGAGFTPEDRAEHNYRVARLAQELSKQVNVVVAVIAPLRFVRAEITKAYPNFEWVYIIRDVPDRPNHFYETPEFGVSLNHNDMDIEESVDALKVIMGIEQKVYSLFIGRWQPLHDGHLTLFDKVRQEGKNIAVGIRDTVISKDNPYSVEERKEMIKEKVPDAKVFVMPDIEEVVYGRKVGWSIREIRLDENTESISATEIRESK